jgi:hypothetical protein
MIGKLKIALVAALFAAVTGSIFASAVQAAPYDRHESEINYKDHGPNGW